jgi:long-chain fatty acid transport protein
MRSLVFAAVAAVVLSTGAQPVAAQGFGIYEQGTCAMGRAGTGVATPCADGSAVFYNPAAVGDTAGLVISGGVTVIAAQGSFTDDLTGTRTNLDNDPIPVPHAFVAYGLKNIGLGVGVFFPYGLGTKWPTTFEGRFSGYDNMLRSMYIQPTAAYHSGKVSIGAALDIVVGSVELNQRLDLFEQAAPPPAPAGTTLGGIGVPFHTQFANAALDAGGATGVGGHAGITFKLSDQLALGARYMTRVKLDYSGTATFTPVATGIVLPAGNLFGVPAGTPLDAVVAPNFAAGGPLSNQNVTTSITMPDQLAAGVTFKPTSSLTVLADYTWVHWQVFDTLTLTFSNAATPTRRVIENYRNTSGVRLGAELKQSDKLTLRGGWIYHQAAAPPETVTPLLPEGTRNEFAGGIGFHLMTNLRADLAYQYIAQQDRRGRVREAPPGQAPSTALNSGLYSFHAHLVALTLTVRL